MISNKEKLFNLLTQLDRDAQELKLDLIHEKYEAWREELRAEVVTSFFFREYLEAQADFLKQTDPGFAEYIIKLLNN